MSVENKIARAAVVGAIALGEAFVGGCNKVNLPLNISHIAPIVEIEPRSVILGYQITEQSGREHVRYLSLYSHFAVIVYERDVNSSMMHASTSSHAVGITLNPKTGTFELIDRYGP